MDCKFLLANFFNVTITERERERDGSQLADICRPPGNWVIRTQSGYMRSAPTHRGPLLISVSWSISGDDL